MTIPSPDDLIEVTQVAECLDAADRKRLVEKLMQVDKERITRDPELMRALTKVLQQFQRLRLRGLEGSTAYDTLLYPLPPFNSDDMLEIADKIVARINEIEKLYNRWLFT